MGDTFEAGPNTEAQVLPQGGRHEHRRSRGDDESPGGGAEEAHRPPVT
jgi:hypothetical protein